jgi:antitoxin component YwqK of YwqJK toxin-antitoxin module
MKLKALILLLFILPLFAFAQRDTINKMDKNGLKQGKWIKKDNSGNKIYEGFFKNDVPLGKFTYFYPTGKVKSKTLFYSTPGQAYTAFYNTFGNKISEGKVNGEAKDSTWILYRSNDSVQAIENYNKGKKQGVFKRYHANGQLFEELTYKNDLREGLHKKYFPNGSKESEINITADKENGKAVFYYLDGQKCDEGAYKNGFRDGLWYHYSNTGVWEWQIRFVNGSAVEKKPINTVLEDYYASGLPRLKYTFKNGQKDGEFIEYYDLGDVKKELIKGKDGYPDEEHLSFTNQKIQSKGTYFKDKLIGEVTYYKKDGTVEKVENYKNGQLVKP